MPSADEMQWHARLLREWGRPPFIHDLSDSSPTRSLLRTSTIQFYLGGINAGAQPHWHDAAWNWLVRGRKRWLLWTPETATYAQRHPTLAVKAATQGGRGAPLACVQEAGDVMLVPSWWGHATINLAPSVGFATELDFDRTIELAPQLASSTPELGSSALDSTSEPVVPIRESASSALETSDARTCSTSTPLSTPDYSRSRPAAEIDEQTIDAELEALLE